MTTDPSFSTIALSAPRSGIRAIVEASANFSDVAHLEVGEPGFQTPEHIVEAAAQALRDGWTKYSPAVGVPGLRERIVEKLKRVNRIHAGADQVLVTVGAAEGLYVSFTTICNPGDEVLIPDPGWSNFATMVHLAHSKPVGYSLSGENDFLPSIEELESLVTARTKAILINSPSNPIGRVIPEAHLRELLEFANRHDLWVISDECYDEITFGVPSVSPAALGITDKIISVFSFSKTYAMTGWRIGYIVVPKSTAPTFARMHEPLISSVSSVAQAAAIAALDGPQDCIREMRDEYARRRDLCLSILAEHGRSAACVPDSAFYLWLDTGIPDVHSGDIALELLREVSVAVAPGTAFGANGDQFLRISFAADTAVIKTGLGRVLDYLSSSPSSLPHIARHR
ncbi:pyridoxal phosphate-dependent aminotransferase [Paenarthrobacter sp. NPDC090522]|uniref:pyridoxal phosphate-dependent aminotransferase n=1 Tax=Paenarthrobacter sp. NPDC090522 TaxID=3364383 RepID=UPI003812819B